MGTARKPLEEVRKFLETGMTLTDASKITGYPISNLSIMAMAWGIKLPQGRPRIWRRAERERTASEK
jgi:hypothetical protein